MPLEAKEKLANNQAVFWEEFMNTGASKFEVKSIFGSLGQIELGLFVQNPSENRDDNFFGNPKRAVKEKGLPSATWTESIFKDVLNVKGFYDQVRADELPAEDLRTMIKSSFEEI